MKRAFWFLVGVAIACVLMAPAFGGNVPIANKYIDLKGNPVIAQRPCIKEAEPKKQLYCVVVKKDEKLYLIILDEQGEMEIVDETGTIWFRDVT